jgi:hypothetical protein
MSMQSLLVQTSSTFFRDAIALVNGFARIATHYVMAPIERLAHASDVAGILPQRAARAAERERLKRAWLALSENAPKRQRPRRRHGMFGCLRALSELT